MRMPGYRIYPLVALSLLAAATVWLERVSRPREAPEILRGEHDPGFITDGARITRHGENGQVLHVLHARQMIHYPENGSTELIAPRLDIDGPDGRAELRADRGRISEQNTRLDLNGSVEVLRPAQNNRAALRFSSNSLTVWPDAQRVRSNEALRVEQDGSRVDARGLDADNLFGTLKLSGEVRARLPASQGKRP